MARFAMCDDCRAEYDDPSDRRFHAQPIACPRCGPMLRLLDTGGNQTAVGEEAAAMAAEAILAGRIVALKGLGGFQLLVDATSPEAVARLRRKKQRPDRPFALMMPTLGDIRRRCHVSDDEARVLSSHEAPIVLLKQRMDAKAAGDVTETVAPGNPYLGAMLPCTPLHHLLTAVINRPVICTSGNLSEEPMAISTGEALERLAPIADMILTHNRPIVRPVDDSVVRIGHGGQQVLRRARGFAPLPIRLDRTTPTILALGGHLKNTVALALPERVAGAKRSGAPGGAEIDSEYTGASLLDSKYTGASLRSATSPPPAVVISPHVGDLDNVLSVEVHRRAAGDLVDFFEAWPEVLVCDLHPDYASTRHAERLASEWDVPLLRVQHHHAHVAACMAEHGLHGPVLGLAWDGTGYGGDGTIWGGEALVCDGADFSRSAHLRTFPLPGGDRAVRQPRRSALGLLFEIMGREAARHTAPLFADGELRTLLAALDRSINSPRTSSMGRLFDAVAALCGLPSVISFEGQAAMALEFAAAEFAANADPEDAYPLPLSDDVPAVADWEPLIRSVLADRAAELPVGRIAVRLHNALAQMAVAAAQRAGCRQVVLSGGCFQNALLTERVEARLSQSGFTVYTHHRVPPGDGGIALGQVFIAAAKAEQ